ncbi:MAG: hypothetical protein GX802_00455, partial [Clostridiales bacterium]|nr:hypothetical protein [Clostridiales bacterium]
ILIGAAVVLVVGFIIFQLIRKKDDAEEIDEINFFNDSEETDNDTEE